MGVEPFLLASTLACVLAQRLVRRLCESCKQPYRPDTAELSLLGLPADAEVAFHAARGCEACGGAGYAGRIGIYEIMMVDDEVRRLVHDDARESDIAAYAARHADTLLASGAGLVRAGRTSSAEVLRVCRQSGDGDGGV
jgi:general secretion pathway protein E